MVRPVRLGWVTNRFIRQVGLFAVTIDAARVRVVMEGNLSRCASKRRLA